MAVQKTDQVTPLIARFRHQIFVWSLDFTVVQCLDQRHCLTVTVSLLEIAVKDRIARQSDTIQITKSDYEI